MSAPPPTPVPSPSRPAARNRAQMIADLEARLQRLEGVMEARIQNLEGEMGARVQTLEEENGRLKLHLEEQIAVLRQQERATSSDVRKVVRVLENPFRLSPALNILQGPESPGGLEGASTSRALAWDVITSPNARNDPIVIPDDSDSEEVREGIEGEEVREGIEGEEDDDDDDGDDGGDDGEEGPSTSHVLAAPAAPAVPAQGKAKGKAKGQAKGTPMTPAKATPKKGGKK